MVQLDVASAAPRARARSDSPSTVLPLSASVLCSELSGREESSAFSWPYCSRAISKGVQNSVSKHLSLTESLEL